MKIDDNLDEEINQQFLDAGLKNWEKNVIKQCLAYGLHRLEKHHNSGLKASRITPRDIKRVLKKFV